MKLDWPLLSIAFFICSRRPHLAQPARACSHAARAVRIAISFFRRVGTVAARADLVGCAYGVVAVVVCFGCCSQSVRRRIEVIGMSASVFGNVFFNMRSP